MSGSLNKEQLSQAGKKGGSAPKHHWVDDENEYVRITYDGTARSVEIMAQHLNLGWQQVKSHVQFMGITNHTGHAHWNPKDDDKVRELIDKLSPAAIARRLTPRRTATAVIVRSKRLGLSRRSRDGWYTKMETCEILGVDHKRVQSFIDSGILKASYHNGTRPQKNGMAMWHIERKAIYDFLRRYPEELNGRNVDLIQIVEILAGLHYGNPC